MASEKPNLRGIEAKFVQIQQCTESRRNLAVKGSRELAILDSVTCIHKSFNPNAWILKLQKRYEQFVAKVGLRDLKTDAVNLLLRHAVLQRGILQRSNPSSFQEICSSFEGSDDNFFRKSVVKMYLMKSG